MFNIPWRKHFKTICALCRHYHKDGSAICHHCYDLFTPIIHSCQYCKMPLSDDKFNICGNCIIKPPYFDRIITNYLFLEPLRTLLHDFKYNNALYLRTFFAKLMLQNDDIDLRKADCIIPMPLHALRIKERGFNQSAELAKLLARSLAIPYENTICKKIKSTIQQVDLNAEQRYKNLLNAFIVKKSAYKYIIIVDDLVTTGSTANSLAKACKQVGVERVDIWCCARAVFKD